LYAIRRKPNKPSAAPRLTDVKPLANPPIRAAPPLNGYHSGKTTRTAAAHAKASNCSGNGGDDTLEKPPGLKNADGMEYVGLPGPPHLRVTAAQAILKNLGWRFRSMAKLVFGLNQSLDGYVDHLAFAPGPALFRHFTEQVRGLTGSVYGRRMYEVMRYWDEDRPEWDAEEHDLAAAWRSQPKWVVSRSLKSVGPNATRLSRMTSRR